MSRQRRSSGGGAKGEKGSSGRSYRGHAGLTMRPRNMRSRKSSSNRWIERQLNDPYVQETHRRGLRSRAAIKLEQIEDRYPFLRPHQRVVDLGCAPGGWLQVASEKIKLNKNQGAALVGIDLLETDPIGGAQILVGDITEPEMLQAVHDAIEGKADVVMSDMAAATTGHRATDHLRTMGLLEVALDFAIQILTPGGTFLAKAFRGGAEKPLMDLLHAHFEKVRHIKPPASRAESVETYLLASGFKMPDDHATIASSQTPSDAD
ncbi:MAG: RlmE family RNA methyltransferase [Candidatus Puniceispirillaceae bacterium]